MIKSLLMILASIFLLGCKTINYRAINYTTTTFRPLNSKDFFEATESSESDSKKNFLLSDKNGVVKDSIYKKIKALVPVSDTTRIIKHIKIAIVFRPKKDTIFIHANGIIEHNKEFFYDRCFSFEIYEIFKDESMRDELGWYSDKYCKIGW